MNKIYKIVWSKAKNCYIVASELAKSHTKAPKSRVMNRALVAGVLACVSVCGVVMPANAQMYYGYNIGSAFYNSDINLFSNDAGGLMLFSSDFIDTDTHIVLGNYPDLTIHQMSINKNGAITFGNTGILSGGTVYSELRPISNGNYITTANTTGVNLSALDAQLKANTDAIANLSNSSGGSTPYVGINSSGGTNQNGEGAHAEDSIAIGKDVSIGNDDHDSIAIGRDVLISGANAVSPTGSNSNNSNSETSIAIGNAARIYGYSGTAVGAYSYTGTKTYATALGSRSYSVGDKSVALGSYSVANDDLVVSVGRKSGDTYWSYDESTGSSSLKTASSDIFRRIVNVANGTANSDVSTVGQTGSDLAINGTTLQLKNANGTVLDSVSLPTSSGGGSTPYVGVNADFPDWTDATADYIIERFDVNNRQEYETMINSKVNQHGDGAVGSGSIALGFDTKVNATDSIAIGRSATIENSSVSGNAISIGVLSHASNLNAVAVGFGANGIDGVYSNVYGTEVGQHSTAIGTAARTTKTRSVALGNDSIADAVDAVAIGSRSVAHNDNEVSFGYDATDINWQGNPYGTVYNRKLTHVADGTANSDVSTVGQTGSDLAISGTTLQLKNASGTVLDSVTLPTSSSGGSTSYVGINSSGGSNTTGEGATGTNAIAIGKNNIASQNSSIAIGTDVDSGVDWSVGIGKDISLATQDTRHSAVGIGREITITQGNTVGIGEFVTVTGAEGIAIGENSTTSGKYAISIGSRVESSGYKSVTLGSFSTANGESSVALGSESYSSGSKSVSIGHSSVSSDDNVVSFGHVAGDIIPSSSTGELYSSDYYRRLINVGDGIDDHDAVTMGQLNTEITNRTTADTALSNRIGTVVSDGTFIKKSATNDVATNLVALDTATKNAITNMTSSGSTITYTKGDGSTGSVTVVASGGGNAGSSKYVGINSPAGLANENGNGAVGSHAIAIGAGALAAKDNSVAIGVNNPDDTNQGTQVNGYAGIAIGINALANGHRAVAIGDSSPAFGDYSVAIGSWGGGAVGDHSIDIGPDNSVTGSFSIGIGNQNNIVTDVVDPNNNASAAIGTNNTLNGGREQFVFGNGTTVNGVANMAFGSHSTTSGSNSLALGNHVIASNDGALGVGVFANATNEGSLAIGPHASSTGNYSVALGTKSVATDNNVVSFGYKAGDIYRQELSNGTIGTYTATDNYYRRLINVADGTDAHDVATVGQLNNRTAYVGVNKSFESWNSGEDLQREYRKKMFNVETQEEYEALTDVGNYNGNGAVAPNSIAVGMNAKAGQRGIAIGTGSVANGLSSVAIGMLGNYSGGNTQGVVAVGNDTNDITLYGNAYNSVGTFSVSLGQGALSTKVGSIALGHDTVANGTSSLALGEYSVAQNNNEVSFGHNADDVNWRGTAYGSELNRKLTHVADGINDHDVATMGQLNTEVTNRTTADTALSNRIGEQTADGNYIKKSSTNNVAQNVAVLDTQLKSTNDALNGLDTLAVKYDDSAKTKVSLQGSGGTTISNVKAGTLSSTSTEAVNGSQLYTTNQNLATETTNRTNADTALSNRIGEQTADGNYIKKSDTNNVVQNIAVLDTQLKSVADSINTIDVALDTKANVDASNVTDATAWGNKIATGSVVQNDVRAVSGDTVYQALQAEKTDIEEALEAKANVDASNVTDAVAWGNKIATGSVLSNDAKAVSGNTMFTELRPTNGNYISQNNTTGENLSALDTQLRTVTNNLSQEVSNRMDADTVLSNRIGTIDNDGNIIKNSNVNNVSANLQAIDTKIGSFASADGTYSKTENTINTNIKALDTAIVTEETVRAEADTVLSNRIGVQAVDGNYIKKSETNDVVTNIALLDAKLGKSNALNGNYTEATRSITSNIKSLDTKIGSANSAVGWYTTAENTVNANIKVLDNKVKNVEDMIGTVNNGQNYITSQASVSQNLINLDSTLKSVSDELTDETTNRFSADTALSNRIGVLLTNGNYVKKSDNNDVLQNIWELDKQLKTTDDSSLKDLTYSENVLTVVKGDGSTSSFIIPDTTYNSMTLDKVTEGSDTTNNTISAKVLNDFVTNKISVETSNRIDADNVLDSRIGTIVTNGNYIRKSDVNNLSANLILLDNELKNTNANIDGFARDITRNKESIRSLNTSVSSALGSVSSTSSLVSVLNNQKADASLNNLTDTGKQIIANAAINAVQEYMASQQSYAIPSAPMMYSSNPNTLSVTDAGNGSLHVGEGSYVNGTSSIAIGVGNQVNANNSGAFGDPSIINADESYVLGNDDTINTGATGSFVVGNDSVSSAKGGLLFGSNNTLDVTAENSVALGNNVTVSGSNSVALGSGSVVTENDTVSVGNSTLKRKITNVADGSVSSTSTDAVTGKQLYTLENKVNANTSALNLKANADASNIDTVAWAEKLGTGKIQENDNNLVTGGTVYDAFAHTQQMNPVKSTDEAIFIGPDRTDNVISVYNKNGEGRTISGVMTNPEDATSATNVGYVNTIASTILENVNGQFAQTDKRINKVGANAAALASLTPASFEGDEKWSLAASVGRFHGETAGAVGAFYKPTENVMLNIRSTVGSDENMLGAGVAVSLSKGDVPGVTKRQLASAVNNQAKEINDMKVSHAQEIANIKADYESKLAYLAKRMEEMEKKMDTKNKNNKLSKENER